MRISDWSSDVCSSDLLHLKMRPTWRSTVRYAWRFHAHSLAFTGYDTRVGSVADLVCGGDRHFRRWPRRGIDDHRPVCFYADRSEEHTSELQSLMRISYAVFCLNKKKHTNKQNKL